METWCECASSVQGLKYFGGKLMLVFTPWASPTSLESTRMNPWFVIMYEVFRIRRELSRGNPHRRPALFMNN